MHFLFTIYSQYYRKPYHPSVKRCQTIEASVFPTNSMIRKSGQGSTELPQTPCGLPYHSTIKTEHPNPNNTNSVIIQVHLVCTSPAIGRDRNQQLEPPALHQGSESFHRQRTADLSRGSSARVSHSGIELSFRTLSLSNAGGARSHL